MISFLAISGVVCALSTKFTLLDYIYFFSFVKLAITIMKYIPQVKLGRFVLLSYFSNVNDCINLFVFLLGIC